MTLAVYNAIGQRTSVSDPNQGTWSFTYDALGELLTQSDARKIVTTTTYDALGRPLTRSATVDVTGDGIADKVLDSWTYDPTNASSQTANGELATSQRTVNGAIERSQTHLYDGLARPIETDTVQQIASGVTKSYKQTIAYDSYYGWPKSIGYPNGEGVATLYSKYGQPIESFNPATGGEVFRSVVSVDARGQPLQAVLGNGTTDVRSYRATTGEMLGIKLTTSAGSTNLRELDYQSDVFGNLTAQSLNVGASSETYTYDALQRMTNATRSGAVSGSVNYAYDQAGNFTSKTDFSLSSPSAYTYTGGSCGGGPNAVKTVAMATGGTRTYCYDANGNLTSDSAGLAVKYDHDNLAYQTTRGSATITMAYGPDNQRTREWGSDGTKVYLDGGYEDWISAGSTKVYVDSDAEITDAGSTRTVNYMLTDRLGSMDTISDASGNIIETRGSDPFGKPRSGTWADLSPPQLQSTAITEHGFTGHAHLNSVQLIHMNGRVYDYQLGRFLSVDPMIQAPLNSQSLNPYSYIMNNPLAGTDPTGYSSCAVGDSAGDCAAGLGEGQTSELKGMDTGSHIVHDEGCVTGTGGGSYSFSAKAGSGLASFTYNGGNGTVTQGVTGAGGRQDQAASNSEKGSASNVAASPSASPAENDPMASKDPPSAYQASDQGSPEDHFIPIDPSQYPSYLKDARDVVKQKFLEPAQFATDALKQSYLHLLDEINLAGSDQRLGWGALADFGRVKITFYGEFLEIQTFRDGTKLEHRVSTVERLGQIMTHEIRHLTEANHRIPESRVDSDLDLLNGAHHDASPRERDADRFEQQIWEHKGGPVNDF